MNIIILIIEIIVALYFAYLIYHQAKRYQHYSNLIKELDDINRIKENTIKINNETLETQQDAILNGQELISKTQKEIKDFADEKGRIMTELDHIENIRAQRVESLEDEYRRLALSIMQGHDNYIDRIEQDYLVAENKFNNDIAELNIKKEQAIQELENVKNSLNAGVQAKIREQEKQQQLEFYKIQINKNDLEDITYLCNLRSKLHQPEILNKLIWSTYYQKKVTEMCNRILSTDTVCGIYKITNLITEQCYVGQSVDIATRWKAHCKCGLGIDAPATNKLYNSMQEYGLHNFTFEVIEQCSRDKLNEKERFWIETYSADTLGLNSNKGNK